MASLTPGAWTKIASDASGSRLDLYLAQRFPELSRARVQKLIAAGQVQWRGAAVKANQLLEVGDEISIFLPAPKPSELQAENIPLEILYQDEHLAVIEKPAGLVVHPAVGHDGGTLVNALLHHFDDLATASGIGGEQRPGIVHRIDRNTSGILLITKSDLAHRHLGQQFKEHSISRRYLGLAWGKLASQGEWTGNIGRDPKERKRMAIVTEGGRHALTRYKCLRSYFDALSLFEAELLTGRTHQIRVHFSRHGFPLVADSTYDDLAKGRRQRELGEKALKKCPAAAEAVQKLREAGRQFLHAAHLGFTHPVKGTRMEFSSPLPPELQSIVLSLDQCQAT